MMGIIRGVSVAATLVSVILLAGCAFGTRQPTLIYPPKSEPSETSVAHAAAIPTPKHVQIILKPFVDQRSNKNVVGTVRNGFGMRTADVIPTNSVDEWVTQAVTAELKNDGYTVFNGAPGDNSAGPSAVVSGEVLNVFCDMYLSYTGQVSVITRVTKDGKEFLNKHYAGEGSAGLAFAGTAESYSQSLALALSSVIKQFVSDLDKSLSVE
ncbi:MAG TPA: YajG family lipoprotein [Thiobacillaceae bacterium]|nr:YajG family lipoprotein [Thiobacillaceae bacterium]